EPLELEGTRKARETQVAGESRRQIFGFGADVFEPDGAILNTRLAQNEAGARTGKIDAAAQETVFIDHEINHRAHEAQGGDGVIVAQELEEGEFGFNFFNRGGGCFRTAD